MKTRIPCIFLQAVAVTLLSGCASSYAPPAERPESRGCLPNEVWVCEDRYPSRIESETRSEPFCRCQDPRRLH